MTDEQNVRCMHDPRRLAAKAELDAATRNIRESLKADGSAGYYMTVLPPLLKRLEQAQENLIIIEATVAAELCGASEAKKEAPCPLARTESP